MSDDRERRAAAGRGMTNPLAAASAKMASGEAEQRDSLAAALLRLEDGQKAIRAELAAVRECLERIEALLVKVVQGRG
jgi:hypothetical protein